MVAKWGYSTMFALQEYQWDAEIELFFLVLTEQCPEAVYDDQRDMVTALQRFCRRINFQESGKEHGVVVKDDLFASLPNFFPLKQSDKLNMLRWCISSEQATANVSLDRPVPHVCDPITGLH